MSAKENLRTTIQHRRCVRGLGELYVSKEDKESKHEVKLSSEEEEKRRIRRLRNKEAANKCRRRKREKIEHLQKTALDLEQNNKDIEDDIVSMKKELKELTAVLEQHECKLSCGPSGVNPT